MRVIKKCLAALCLVGLFVVFSQSVYAADGITETTFFGNLQDDGKGCGVFLITNMIVDILSTGVAILGAIGIAIVGVSYLTAKGDVGQATRARKRLFQIIIGLAIYATLYVGIQWLLPGGKMNNSSCKTLTDAEVARIKEESREARSSGSSGGSSSSTNGGKLTGKTSYDKKIDAKPFKLDVSGASNISYKSSNSRIAWVNKKGVVYPNDIGTAYITASSGGNSLKIKVKVGKRTTKPTMTEVPAHDVITRKYTVGGAFYSYDYVFRYKNPEKAELAADNALLTAKNNKVVGHEGNNYSFTQEMAKKSVNWDPRKVKKRVATACSQFVLTMAQSTGLHRSPLRWAQKNATGAASNLKKSSNFYTIKDRSYTRDWKKLRRGDILIDTTRGSGGAHAVMISK